MPNPHKNINFFKKNIGPTNSDFTTNLHQEIEEYNNIFLKMDIEGHEFPWIKSLNEA